MLFDTPKPEEKFLAMGLGRILSVPPRLEFRDGQPGLSRRPPKPAIQQVGNLRYEVLRCSCA